MIVLGTYVSLFYYIGEGPYWPDNMDQNCRTNWWINILYLNNVLATDKGVRVVCIIKKVFVLCSIIYLYGRRFCIKT